MDRRQKYFFPILTFVFFPLLILLLIFLLNNFLFMCLTETDTYKELTKNASVLGVSSFDTSAAKTRILDNETVLFTTTATTDNGVLGIVNGTIVFNLTGEGRMGETIDGPGLCTRVSELRAVCTAVNVPSSETVAWRVPVTSKSTCSQSATPTITMVATLSSLGVVPETSEDTAIVTCDTASSTTGGTTTGGNTTGGTTGGTTTGSSTGGSTTGATPPSSPGTTTNNGSVVSKGTLNGEDVLAILNKHNKEVYQCLNAKSVNLSVVLLVLLLIGLLIYFMAKGRIESETDIR